MLGLASRTRVSTLLAVLSVVAWTSQATPVHAQQTKEEQKCRSTIAKSYGKYVKAAQKAISTCHSQRAGGTLPETTDCNDVAVVDTAGKVGLLATKAADAIATQCALAPAVVAQFGRCPTPFETVDDAGTPGIDNTAELTVCLAAHAEDLIETLAGQVLGTPVVPLSPELLACHGALGKSYTKYVDTIVKARSKCQLLKDKAGDPLGFGDCVLDDSTGKIQKTRDKAAIAITNACAAASALNVLSRAGTHPRSISDLGSCADDVAGLADCALDRAAKTTGTGVAAMLFELPGTCPGGGAHVVSPVATDTDLDIGWTGLAHNRDPILGYQAVQFSIACDADCANCASTGVGPAPGACRCSGDASEVCTTPGADPACTGIGSCECFYGPPTPYAAVGQPACVMPRIDGAMTGSLDPATGAVSLTVPLRQRIHLGLSLQGPCPLCVAGACEGGERDGLACTVDASDATFGDVSYDCPPSSGSNISGLGVRSPISYSTGHVSLPFGTKCAASGPYATFDCACAACSGDGTVVCNSNADCAAVAAGTCNDASTSRRPNNCDDSTCTDVGGEEGECIGSAPETYCDGWLTNSGGGLLTCSSNFDCEILDSVCPGGDCGACSFEEVRGCFLNPIEATGAPGESIVGVGCVGQTTHFGVNMVLGLPGAFRVKQNLGVSELLCSDGVTEFAPPGGSNCP